MTLNAMTSIERGEKRNSGNPDIQHRFAVAHIKYDRGYYDNWIHVMGQPHIWLFPIDPNPEDDGTYSNIDINDIYKER